MEIVLFGSRVNGGGIGMGYFISDFSDVYSLGRTDDGPVGLMKIKKHGANLMV
jgi:hypothetical protein